jgi:hypothetical protein
MIPNTVAKATPERPPGSAVPMEYPEKMRVRRAAFRATRVYPGPVGQLIAKELNAWEEFGMRLGGHSLIMGVVEAIEQTPEHRPDHSD